MPSLEGLSFSDLYDAVLDLMPDAIFDQDETGEITISTGFIEVTSHQNPSVPAGDSVLVPYTEKR